MKGIQVCPLVSAVFLASCSTVPHLSKSDEATVADVVQNVLCDFKEAQREAPFLSSGVGWTAGVELQFQVVNGTVDSLETKLAMPSHFVPVVSAGYQGSADVTRMYGFAVDYSENFEPKCSNLPDRDNARRLRGNLGITRWVKKMQETYDLTGAQPNKAGYKVEFIITKSAGLTPGIADLTVDASLLNITPVVSGSRKDVNTLTIGFTKNPAEPKPTEVIIVSGGKTLVKPATPVRPRKKKVIIEPVQPIIPVVPDDKLLRNDRVINNLNKQEF